MAKRRLEKKQRQAAERQVQQEEQARIDREQRCVVGVTRKAGERMEEYLCDPEGESAARILEKAHVTLELGEVITIGAREVTNNNLQKTIVKPGDALVVTTRHAHG